MKGVFYVVVNSTGKIMQKKSHMFNDDLFHAERYERLSIAIQKADSMSRYYMEDVSVFDNTGNEVYIRAYRA